MATSVPSAESERWGQIWGAVPQPLMIKAVPEFKEALSCGSSALASDCVLGKTSWQSHEQSLWEKLDQDDIKRIQVGIEGKEPDDKQKQTWVDGVEEQGRPMQGEEKQPQQTLQASPRSLPQETGKAGKEEMRN